jgi:hypothetical protein
MATSLSLLAWSLVEFKAGYQVGLGQPWWDQHQTCSHSQHLDAPLLVCSTCVRQGTQSTCGGLVQPLFVADRSAGLLTPPLLPQAASVDDQAIDILSHGVKYLMRCHNAAGRTFVVQIGEPADYVVDTSRVAGFWGLP